MDKARFSCVVCGSTFYKPLHRLKYDKNLYCARKCMYEHRVGANHPGFKGGNINNQGYRRIRVDKKLIFEHRHVMEQQLGRKLKPTEHIHHIDKNKLNNSIENLKLVSNSEHHFIHMIEDINKAEKVRGVSFDKSRNRWFVRISHNKHNIMLGRFKTFDEAVRVRKQAEIKYGYISGL